MSDRPAMRIVLWPVLALAACHGPGLTVATDGECYVDGARLQAGAMPFRYYGTTTVDTLPPGAGAATDFRRVPARQDVDLDPPCWPWLFPFDFLGELAVRGLRAPEPVAIQARTAAAEGVVVEGFPPSGIDELKARATAARISR